LGRPRGQQLPVVLLGAISVGLYLVITTQPVALAFQRAPVSPHSVINRFSKITTADDCGARSTTVRFSPETEQSRTSLVLVPTRRPTRDPFPPPENSPTETLGLGRDLSVELTVLSEQQAEKAFCELMKLPQGIRSDDLCIYRTHMNAIRLSRLNIKSGKVFASQAGNWRILGAGPLRPKVPGLQLPSINWRQHVANVIRVRSSAGVVEDFVIDPILAPNGPVPLSRWQSYFRNEKSGEPVFNLAPHWSLNFADRHDVKSFRDADTKCATTLTNGVEYYRAPIAADKGSKVETVEFKRPEGCSHTKPFIFPLWPQGVLTAPKCASAATPRQ
jgi:hypothetical protein